MAENKATSLKPDLSPIRLTVVAGPYVTLALRKPLEITPFLDGQEIVAELPELGIIAAGATRDAVIRDLKDQFMWVWREYGLADDAKLSGDARRLKQVINDLVKETREMAPPVP